MQVNMHMRRDGMGISHGVFTSFIYELFVMVLENQFMFVNIERRVDLVFFYLNFPAFWEKKLLINELLHILFCFVILNK